jgi:hypothetical protein
LTNNDRVLKTTPYYRLRRVDFIPKANRRIEEEWTYEVMADCALESVDRVAGTTIAR